MSHISCDGGTYTALVLSARIYRSTNCTCWSVKQKERRLRDWKIHAISHYFEYRYK